MVNLMDTPSQREYMRDELRALKIENPVVWAMIMGNGTRVKIASALQMTMSEVDPMVDVELDAGRIVLAYGTTLQLRSGREENEQFSKCRDYAVRLGLRKPLKRKK